MAKGGKNYNPADAYRKAQRKKEVAKNKESRKQAKELATVKKDTSEYEAEILRLSEQEKTTPLSLAQKSRLQDLQSEVSRINHAKEVFLQAHPEQRRLVHASRPRQANPHGEVREDRSLFGKNGLPLRPERSVYYHPVMNQWGMPPPGMPYVERDPTPEADDMQQDSDSSFDAASPSAEGLDLEKLESIPLPPGPAPRKFIGLPPLPKGPPPMPPPLPPGMGMHAPPMPVPMHGFGFGPMAVPGPAGAQMPMPQGYLPQGVTSAAPVTYSHALPQPQPPHPHPHPQSLPLPPASLPPKPAETRPEPLPAGPGGSAGATISAPAELRDLKREATAFVPMAVRKAGAVGK
ncbi:hypothetical protein DACRYDRAFT_115653 [Dacryopinax primogenitus]|uniref:Wbp11/ELF5/Saf1 N-terminal domain-containing protein n=1 Tax=Dacryopinax primogenitus (strain DJM 731) TaxID=1858805 RepID=M5G1M6_DACPD|nr:uncharacterized protein DACRYDRAFT_115653 [Dacryopinax primogenitus]EJU02619.1 hypothetical protein DACRYDRAFT_115653 [Dacryopinax primogenitus]